MELQTWVIGQIIIEAVIILLILWFIKSHLALRKKNEDLKMVFSEPENILSEMKELTHQFDQNLEDKKELSNRILGQLDEVLEKADQSYMRLQGIIKEYSSTNLHNQNNEKESNRIRTSVNNLLEKGLPKEEIAQHLGISVSEIELLIKLQNHQLEERIVEI